MNWLLKISRLFYPSLRRRYLYYCKRSYVLRMIAKRQGSCAGCGGICCIRTRRCPFLQGENCSLYDSKMLLFCKIFPIDQQDIALSGVEDVCRYYWEKEDSGLGKREAAEDADG